MEKLRLGTIGTSWITNDFIDAALETDLYDLACVYSRYLDRAEEFARPYGEVSVEDDLEQFMNSDLIDVVYIASPNSLHYNQTLLALKAKKHVIVEKPASINVEQWDEMLKVAKENGVFVFEAARHLYSPNQKVLKEELTSLGKVQGATFAYMQYSSKYDAVRAGEEPNVFSLKFAGGALMDLGIYPIYTAVALFGEPQGAHYFPRKVHTGVDGIGTVILQYETFDVTILVSKAVSTRLGGEIYGEDETIYIDHIADLGEATLVGHKSAEEKELPFVDQNENQMVYEAKAFAEMILNPKDPSIMKRYEEVSKMARIVSKILYDLRMQTDIIFE